MSEGSNGELALIFDLDGVLVHSMPLHTLAWEHYLKALGVHVDDLEQRMHGKRNPELVHDFIGTDLDNETVLRHGAAKEQMFRDMLLATDVNHYRMPGLLEFLERHEELPKAVGSNAEPANIEFVLDRFGLRRFFPVTIDGFQVQRPKPFPDIYLKAAELLRVEPGKCIVFEDSPPGVQAARSAGMRVVGVESTPTEFQGVELRIKDYLDPQLEPWLESQTSK